MSVLFKGGWTVAWRRFHARRPVVAEMIRWTPTLALWGFIVLQSTFPLWGLALVTAALVPLRLWVDYRPNGRGTRLLQANRTDPRRGFEWAMTDSADPAPSIKS